MHARVSAYRGTSVDPVDEVSPEVCKARALMEAVGSPRANRLQSAISGR